MEKEILRSLVFIIGFLILMVYTFVIFRIAYMLGHKDCNLIKKSMEENDYKKP